ncbi:hypothetical protein [Sphingopyxis chilensis]
MLNHADATCTRAVAVGTGATRRQLSRWIEHLPPCHAACPAGGNIQAWLDLAQAGKYREAWEMLVRDNPLPSVHGRACYHPCETSCNRVELDAAVSIHAVERFLGDLAVAEGWPYPVDAEPSGKRVLVVGADSHPEMTSYPPPLCGYRGFVTAHVETVLRAAESIAVPLIASLSATTRAGWTGLAAELEAAGAAALELNFFHLPTDSAETSADVEQQLVETVRDIGGARCLPFTAGTLWQPCCELQRTSRFQPAEARNKHGRPQ